MKIFSGLGHVNCGKISTSNSSAPRGPAFAIGDGGHSDIDVGAAL